MKKITALVAAAALFAGAAFADSQNVNTNAWFDLKTHTTLGYNFEEDVFGMESTLDQAQIWWEFMPYATRGAEPSKSQGLQASVRIEGLKYAFKFYNEKKSYTDNNNQGDFHAEGDTKSDQQETTGWRERPGAADDKESNYFNYERIVSEVKYKNWFMNFYNYDYNDGPVAGFSNASLCSIFDDLRNFKIFDKDGDNSVGILYFNGIRDSRNTLSKGNYGLTGILSTGFNFDKADVMVSVGTPGSWIAKNGDAPGQIKSGKSYQKLNEHNKVVLQLNTVFRPVENLTINADALGTINYYKKSEADETAGISELAHDIYTAGIGVSYKLPAGEKGVIAPYAGFDFNHTIGREDDTNLTGDDTQIELGAGVAWYWRGEGVKTSYDVIDYWGRQFPIGLSVGMNADQDGRTNLVISALEKADKDALIPNLGGFFELEWLNIGEVKHEDSALFLAGQLEYVIGVPVSKRKSVDVKPYIFGRLIQNRGDDLKRTDAYNLDTRVGVIVYPCARFSVDLRYERADVIWDKSGVDNDLDKGCLTCRCDVRL